MLYVTWDIIGFQELSNCFAYAPAPYNDYPKLGETKNKTELLPFHFFPALFGIYIVKNKPHL